MLYALYTIKKLKIGRIERKFHALMMGMGIGTHFESESLEIVSSDCINNV